LLEHGGNLRRAAELYQRPMDQWIDLSTGINPNGWPVPQLPHSLWQRLPDDRDELIEAARAYYGCQSLLSLPGSQAAIQALPRLRAPCRVGVLSPGYAEHAYRWERSGHQAAPLSSEQLDAGISGLDVVIVSNPNNPDGVEISREKLLEWRNNLAGRDGLLVVDEAFGDAMPGLSLASESDLSNLVVLRSLGKFFGLAGVRVGFAIAEQTLLDQLAEECGPWAVGNPSRWIAAQALADTAWQQQTRDDLIAASERLDALLKKAGLSVTGGTALFRLVRTPKAAMMYDALASRGILVRIFRDISSLRFGLPGDESEWQRLEQALL
jgi:cobalamin biosynthetic protein CobC